MGQRRSTEELIQEIEELRTLVGELDSLGSDLATVVQELRENRQVLDRAQTIARLGSWEEELATRQHKWSSNLYAILGYSSIGTSPCRDLLIERIHPDDLETVKTTLSPAFDGVEPRQADFRIVRADGEERSIHCFVEPIVDRRGNPLKVQGVIQDVTELKRAEDFAVVASHVFEKANEGVVITDALGIIREVNTAFSTITGYAQDEVVGKSTAMLQSGRHSPEFYDRMWQRLNSEGEWSGEVWNRRKNGEAYPQSLTITAIKGADGRPAKYLGVFHTVTEVKTDRKGMESQRNFDALTKLPNRNRLHDRLDVAIEAARKSGSSVGLLWINLDNFRDVNASLGYGAGDSLLQAIARRLETARGEATTLFRYGGAEFILLVEEREIEPATLRESLALLKSFSDPFVIHGRELTRTASIGISIYPDDASGSQSLIKNGSLASKKAKERGLNTYQYYTDELDSRISRRLTLEMELRRAYSKSEFLLHYQPKVSLKTNRIVGFEALIRWKKGSGEMVLPGEFITVTEETGLIVPVSVWGLKAACVQLNRWRDMGHSDLTISVNISANHFQTEELRKTILEVVEETGLPPGALELEVTESVLMDDLEGAKSTLAQIERMGARAAMDDFGTGFSSLSFLRNLPFNTIKVDKGFIDPIPDSHEDVSVVSSIISIVHSLGMEVVAEGVETRAQLASLRDLGCDMLQGFVFSKALPPAKAEALLKSGRTLED